MIAAAGADDSTTWLRVSGLDGVPSDSIPVQAPPLTLWSALALPGTPWLALMVSSFPRTTIRIIDRKGVTHAQVELSNGSKLRTTHDAVWLQVGNNATILRFPVDPASGKLSARVDTVSAVFPAPDARGSGTWDVTADGSAMVVDAGTYSYDIFALAWPDLAAGHLPDHRRILQTSSQAWLALAPAGDKVAVFELEPGTAAKARLSMIPFAGGPSHTLLSGVRTGVWGVLGGTGWPDSTSVTTATRVGPHVRLERVNAQSAVRTDGLTLSDSSVGIFDWLATGGWTWITDDFHHLKWQALEHGEPRAITLPDWYSEVLVVRASPDGRLLAFYGPNRSLDSMRFSVASLPDGVVTPWFTVAGEGAWPHWLADNTLVIDVHTGHGLALYHLAGPGKAVRVGGLRREVISLGISHDMKRAAVATREYRGDIWMNHVVR